MAALVIHSVVVIAVCAVIFGCALLVARWRYQYLKSKGYSSPWINLLLGAWLFAVFFLGVWALTRSHHDNDLLYVILFMTAPLMLATAGTYAVARMVPARARRGGARQVRFPFKAAGWILLTTAILQLPVVYALAGSKGISSSAKMAQAGIGASFFCFYLAKRSRAASATELLQTDPRAPVLYLRPFIAEEDYFAVLSNAEAAEYSSYLGTKTGATFEQYFARAVEEAIGPFVALGNPLDYAPPEGAARLYDRDENWKQDFQAMARAAKCILIQVGESANLAWELHTLRMEGLLTKVFIFTPPATTRRLSKKSLRLTAWVKGIRTVPWPEFAQGLRNAGYAFALEEPAAGSVLAFHPDGSGVLLGFGAHAPAEYLALLRQRTENSPLHSFAG